MNDSNLISATVGAASSGGRKRYFVDPKAGMYGAVCVDVIDHGFVRDNFGKINHKLQFAFQLDETIDEKAIKEAKKRAGLDPTLDEEDEKLVGKQYMVWSRKFNLSLYPGGTRPDGGSINASALYNFLVEWFGEPLAEGVEVKFEELVGRTATLLISKQKDLRDPSRIYTNIASIMPPEEGVEVEPDGSYVRVKDRENYTAPPTREQVEAEAAKSAQVASAGVGTSSGRDDDDIPWLTGDN